MDRTWLLTGGFAVTVAMYAVLSQVWVGADAGWYEGLPKPPWQPPDVVFGIVWPLNFVALVVAGIVLSRQAPERAGGVLAVLAISVVLALAWAYLFYVPHALMASAWALGAAALLTWVVLVMAAQAVGWLGLVLAPYAVWMSLATSLAVWFALNVP